MEEHQTGGNDDFIPIDLELEELRQEETREERNLQATVSGPKLWAPKFRHFGGRVTTKADCASRTSGVAFGLLRGICIPKEASLVPQLTFDILGELGQAHARVRASFTTCNLKKFLPFS